MASDDVADVTRKYQSLAKDTTLAGPDESMRGPEDLGLTLSNASQLLVDLRSHDDEACKLAEAHMARMMSRSHLASIVLKWRETLRLSVAGAPDDTLFRDNKPADIAKTLVDTESLLWVANYHQHSACADCYLSLLKLSHARA